jgi:hypothetical protein
MNILPTMAKVYFEYNDRQYCATGVPRLRRVPEYNEPFRDTDIFNDILVTTENGVEVGFVDNGYREMPTGHSEVDEEYEQWCKKQYIESYLACQMSVDRFWVDQQTGYLMADCKSWSHDADFTGFYPDDINYIRFEQGRWFFSISPPEVSYARPL